MDYVYCWADGIHVNVRLEEERLCLLVLVGVRADGTKELITLADGYRECAGSWADLLRGAAGRGMRAPVVAVADGAREPDGEAPERRRRSDHRLPAGNSISGTDRPASAVPALDDRPERPKCHVAHEARYRDLYTSP